MPFSSPGDLPEPRIEPMSLVLAGGANEPPRKPLKEEQRYDIVVWETNFTGDNKSI